MTEPQVEIDLSTVDKAEGADRLSAILMAIASAEDRERISIGDLLEALKRRAQFVKVLGSYPAWRWPDGEAKP